MVQGMEVQGKNAVSDIVLYGTQLMYSLDICVEHELQVHSRERSRHAKY